MPKILLFEFSANKKPVSYTHLEMESCDAILQAWYPGQAGGLAVADVLFGDFNPSGKLPVTFYKSTDQLPDFEDYSMKNRTYRYMVEAPLFPFGYGLSYTTFDISKGRLNKKSISAGKDLNFKVNVKNTGKCDGCLLYTSCMC